MVVLCNLVEKTFKNDNGQEQLYYRLEYSIDSDNVVSIKLSKSDAMLIMLSEKTKNE